MKKIYLDYASSTPIDKDTLKEVNKIQKLNYANASSVHSLGRESALILDTARETVSKFLNCDFNEIIFTSCATESNNLAIKGLCESYINSNKKIKPHVITTKIEHPSVLNVIKELENQNKIEWCD